MSRWQIFLLFLLLGAIARAALASDHADPIDLPRLLRQEGAITDLFVFPVTADGKPAFPFSRDQNLPLHDLVADVVRNPLSDDQLQQIDSLVVILCVRRQLSDAGSLILEPYTYRVCIDFDSSVEFPGDEHAAPASQTNSTVSADHDNSEYDHYGIPHQHGNDEATLPLIEAFARYGGKITNPDKIKEDITIEFRLDNNARFQNGYPRTAQKVAWSFLDRAAGVYDDPFIFPAFFGNNVVAMAVRIPMRAFPESRDDLLIWATSSKGDKQIDHVGRSLRTQNPRFELLNTLHPSKHVTALLREKANPSLMRDVLLRINFSAMFAFREWDFVPDVMCYSRRLPAGFPNGRLLTDDVAAILAQHGDTLLYELSFEGNSYRWPRQTTNDGRQDGTEAFGAKFPYLLPPNATSPAATPYKLSFATKWKLAGITLFVLLGLALTHWLFARWYYHFKSRKRYL